MQAREDGGLLQVVDAVGEDAAGDDDQQHPGPAEERAEVDAHRALVDRDAEGDGRTEADDPADERLHGAGAGRLRGRVEEDRGLEALPADAQEADFRQAGTVIPDLARVAAVRRENSVGDPFALGWTTLLIGALLGSWAILGRSQRS